jgi:uncharacterized protein YecT (DUF1311 family)
MKAPGLAACLLLMLPMAASAAGADCRHSTSGAERIICATPALRAADTEMNALYATVRAALRKPLDTALHDGQRIWLRARDHDCADAACLAARIADRRAILAALAARISEANPTLQDVTAVWLEGIWRIDPPTPASLQQAVSLPGAGETLSFRPGELCRAGSCGDFGLEPQTLADGPGREGIPAQLGLSPATPFYLAYIDGKAAYGLVASPTGGIIALTQGCAPAGTSCTIVRQTWRPDPGAALHVATAAARSAGEMSARHPPPAPPP